MVVLQGRLTLIVPRFWAEGRIQERVAGQQVTMTSRRWLAVQDNQATAQTLRGAIGVKARTDQQGRLHAAVTTLMEQVLGVGIVSVSISRDGDKLSQHSKTFTVTSRS